MKARIMSRLMMHGSLVLGLAACSDATQFAESTVPSGGLDAKAPVTGEEVVSPEGDDPMAQPGDEITGEESDGGSPVPGDGEVPVDDGSGSEGGSGTPGSGTGGSGSTPGSGTGGSGSTPGGGTGPAGNPADEIFSDCDQYPDKAIVSHLYVLPENTSQLPNFEASTSIGNVCVSQLNIADRDFTQGFPGVQDLIEWFALDMYFTVQVPVSGTYQFTINSDDGSRLSIDGTELINNDGLHSQQAKSASRYLSAGPHNFRVKYYQGPRQRIALELFWKVPGSSQKVLIPQNVISRPQ